MTLRDTDPVTEGTRAAVEVHTVSLDDGRGIVGVFGIMEVETEYAAPAPLREALTPRQHEVLAELARGASTEQIAASLGVARETVRNHVRGVLRSLRVHSRLEAVAEKLGIEPDLHRLPRERGR